MDYQTCPNCGLVYLGVSQSLCPQCRPIESLATTVATPATEINTASRTTKPKRKPKRRDNTLPTMLAIAGGLVMILLFGVILCVLFQATTASNQDTTSPLALPTNNANPAGEKRLSISRSEFRNRAATFPQGDNYNTGQQWHLSGKHWVMAFGEPHKVRFQNVNQTMIWRCSDGLIAVICLARPEPLAERNSPKGEKLIIKSIVDMNESDL